MSRGSVTLADTRKDKEGSSALYQSWQMTDGGSELSAKGDVKSRGCVGFTLPLNLFRTPEKEERDVLTPISMSPPNRSASTSTLVDPLSRRPLVKDALGVEDGTQGAYGAKVHTEKNAELRQNHPPLARNTMMGVKEEEEEEEDMFGELYAAIVV